MVGCASTFRWLSNAVNEPLQMWIKVCRPILATEMYNSFISTDYCFLPCIFCRAFPPQLQRWCECYVSVNSKLKFQNDTCRYWKSTNHCFSPLLHFYFYSAINCFIDIFICCAVSVSRSRKLSKCLAVLWNCFHLFFLDWQSVSLLELWLLLNLCRLYLLHN